MTSGKYDVRDINIQEGRIMPEQLRSEFERCRCEVDEAIAELHTKFDTHVLTDAEIEKVADKAATKAIEKLTTMAYLEIGKGVVAKVFKIVGIIAAFGVFYWHDKIWPTK